MIPLTIWWLSTVTAFALQSDQSCIEEYNGVYAERLQMMVEALTAIGINVDFSKASYFFVWAPVPAGYTSSDFVKTVLEKTHVIVTPGSAFGPSGEGYFRMSASVSNERIRENLR
ncbi:aminotransferase class I/II-fold pyridoxal phosphate-dependent enzyme [Brevibacillus sp. B_LB10_24]|uniref:aminotransferase class I/II-fold pyridoxal phosphate-dependent enzyme n=1 Tax=Brevibacillus sp. B_LB10_24 TaxID=3380645 RepID=UPI0038B6F735